MLCGIPLRRPPRTQLIHSRRNGRLFLDINGHPEFGLPFGQDRLIPIWVGTLAVQQENRNVRFESAAQMLDFFRLSKDGRHYRRIIQGFRRIVADTIFFGREHQPGRSLLADSAPFISSIGCAFGSTRHQPEQPLDDESGERFISLSQAFYQELDQHRIPVEREVTIRPLTRSRIAGFYMWVGAAIWSAWACLPVRLRSSVKWALL